MENKNVFIPALGVIHYSILRNKKRSYINNYKLDFWSENSLFKYPNILISAAFVYKHKNFRRDLGLEKSFVIGDSGGYQIYTSNINISPRIVMEWFELNVDIGFILDVPGDVTNYSLKKTEENIQEMLRYRKGNMKLYNIMQGKDYNSLVLWYKIMEKFNKDVDGWGVGGIRPASNIFLLALKQIFTSQYNNKIHILGIAGRLQIIIIYYISKLFNTKKLTLDSASYGIKGGNKIYMNNFYDLHLKTNNIYNFNKLICDCPVCIKLNNEFINFINNNSNFSQGVTLFYLHNLWKYIEYMKFVEQISNDKILMEQIIVNELGKKGEDLIDFIIIAKEKGIEEAYKKYKKYFIGFEVIYNQKNIKNNSMLNYF